MVEPGPYVIVPFLRPARPASGGTAMLWVRSTHGATRVMATVVRGNGQVAVRGPVGDESEVVGTRPQSCAALCATAQAADLFALVDCGAVHLSAADDTPLVAELRPGGASEGHLFGDADRLCGHAFHLEATDEQEPFAVLANGGESELFVFVNDRQGPFIPPGGAARIQIPRAGGPLHLLIESGDAVLSYQGAPVHPIA